MSGDVDLDAPSPAQLVRRVEQESQARELATIEASEQRGIANALDVLSRAILASDAVDELFRTLLPTLRGIAQADVAIACLVDAERLDVQGACGVEAPVGSFLPGNSSFLRKRAEPSRCSFEKLDDAERVCAPNVLRDGGHAALHALALRTSDQLVGMIFFGTRRVAELPDAAHTLLETMASRCAAAIQRIEAQRALSSAVATRDEVLAIVAHDLRNPINVIAITANTLLLRLPESAARRPVERIIRGAERADRLIQDLLEINAIEGGRFSVDTATVETTGMVLAALESQQSLAASASVIIAPDLSPDLPAIEADEERLLEVLENLVGNAVKFTSPGGSVIVGATRQDDQVLFWVKDSGAGIPAEQVPRVFDRFWQAQRMDRRGSGLGLAICRAIVEAHGGRIWAESQLGEGTTMFFTIPAKPTTPSNVSDLQTANILLVDDRAENLLALQAILEGPGYRLVTATSGEQALSLALREHFALALIDVAMPGMDGLEVAVNLKALERSRDIPIIFITAFGDDPEEVHRAYSAGGADYLVKPLDAEIVRKKVAVFVDLNRRRRDAGQRRRLKTPDL